MSRRTLFRIFALLFVAAAIYHAAAFAHPALSEGGTRSRHAAFFAIDLLFAWYMLKRPRWFVAAFSLLTLETLYGHGLHAWKLWHDQGRLDWLSFAVLIAVPCMLAFLIAEARGRSRVAGDGASQANPS